MNLADLLHKIASNEATPEELSAFTAHLATLGREEYEQLLDTWGDMVHTTNTVTGKPDTALLTTIQQEIEAIEKPHTVPDTIALKTTHKRRWLYYSAAAAVIIGVLIGTYFIADQKPVPPPVAKTSTPIPPGRDRAVLTLANGQQLVLDDAKQGDVASQGNVKIIKLNSGLITYHAGAHKTGEGETQYNTITTPRGGQYQLVLPDGTHAWLNAASSLRFPIAFNGRDRKVELTGEGYFDVAQDAAHPFTVAFRDMQVQALGTEFNIRAYDDEPATRSTLVSGSTRVTRHGQALLLQPGHTAVALMGSAQGALQTEAADIEQVTAWKNGKILLTNADLPMLMHELSRWYDVNIHFTGAAPDTHFFGLINRNVYLGTILDYLQKNGVHIKQEGRNITILP